jgi:hypothetical protein
LLHLGADSDEGTALHGAYESVESEHRLFGRTNDSHPLSFLFPQIDSALKKSILA